MTQGALQMKLKGKISTEDEFNGLTDDLKASYSKSGDAWLLDVDLSGTGYESALNKIKTERTEVKKELEALSKFKPLMDLEDFDPSKAGEYMQKAINADNTDVDKAVEDATRPLLKKLEASELNVNAQMTLAQKAVEDKKDYIISGQVTKAAIKAGVLPDAVENVYTLTKGRFALDESNNVSVVDNEGDITGASPSDFFSTDFKDSHGYMYQPVEIKGSGSKPNQGQPKSGENLSPIDMISAGLAAR